jgi:hypothetical protein
MGPACGLTSCVRVVEEEEDATAFVEAITDSSGRSGKERIVGKVELAPGKDQRSDASIKLNGRRRRKRARGTGGW